MGACAVLIFSPLWDGAHPAIAVLFAAYFRNTAQPLVAYTDAILAVSIRANLPVRLENLTFSR
jgi:hypothetical protein